MSDKTIKFTIKEEPEDKRQIINKVYNALKEKGYNPQKQLLVIAQDLDIKAVHMSYIQLSLLGIPAVVYHMNTLSLEAYSEWKTPFWIINNGDRRWKNET